MEENETTKGARKVGPVLILSPGFLQAAQDFDRRMNESVARVNAVLQPLHDSLIEGVRRAAESLNKPDRG